MPSCSPLTKGRRQTPPNKQGLIKAVAAKGPKAIQAAVDTAAKAAKRRDGYAQKLAELGVALPD